MTTLNSVLNVDIVVNQIVNVDVEIVDHHIGNPSVIITLITMSTQITPKSLINMTVKIMENLN